MQPEVRVKYLRQLVGRRVLVQLEHAGAALDGILDVAEHDHVELVDVDVVTSADQRRAADGRMYVPALSIVWVQLP